MRHRSAILIVALLSLPMTGSAAATAPLNAAPSTDVAQTPAAPLSAEALTELVAPVALYPDDLLGIVLPASTYPLQVVQAARFLEALKNDATLKPDPAWDDSIVALLNYPEVVALLDRDIDWTWRLGEAVLNQHDDVVAAVADFREQARVAGNLKSDDRQVVTQNADSIEIRPANPQVIYVPYYEPAQVVVYQPAPVYYYYPTPYPVYYYPYPVGYDFYSPYFWGVTSIFSIAWASHHVHVCHIHHHHHRYYGYYYDHDHYYYRHPYRHYDGGYAYWGRSYDRDRYGDDDVWQADRRHSGGRPGYRDGRGDYAARDDAARNDAAPIDAFRDRAGRNHADRDRRQAGDPDRDRAPRAGGDRQWNAGRAGTGATRDQSPENGARFAGRSAADRESRGNDLRQRFASNAPRSTERLGFAPRQGHEQAPSAPGTVRRWQGSGPRSNVSSRGERVVATPSGRPGAAPPARPAAAPSTARSAARPPQNAWAARTRTQPSWAPRSSNDRPRAQAPPTAVPAFAERRNANPTTQRANRTPFAGGTPDVRRSVPRTEPRVTQGRAPAAQVIPRVEPRQYAAPRERPQAEPRPSHDFQAPERRESHSAQRAERGEHGGNDRGRGEGRAGGRSAQR